MRGKLTPAAALQKLGCDFWTRLMGLYFFYFSFFKLFWPYELHKQSSIKLRHNREGGRVIKLLLEWNRPLNNPEEHPRMMQVRTLSPTTAGFGFVKKIKNKSQTVGVSPN